MQSQQSKSNGCQKQAFIPSVVVRKANGSSEADRRPTSTWESIGPEKAKEYLLTNVEHQRTLSQRVVEKYASDMKAGLWRISHQGIAFDSQGRLIDGQHRLNAIVASGMTVMMLVFRGAASESMLVIDDGKIRPLQSTMKIVDNLSLSNLETATGTRMYLGATGQYTMTKQVLRDYLMKHIEAISWVCSRFQTCRVKGVRRAPVTAVLARAWYTSDRAKLMEFTDVLAGGIASKQAHRIIVTLRDWLTQHATRGTAGKGTIDASSVYKKTQRALYAFLNGERIKTLYEASEELFPLPGEKR